MATPIQQNLVAKNQEYVAHFTQGHLALPPAKKYVVVTCMDARIDPASALGITLGDAHVIRNAGASAHDALRSIIISNQLLGTTEILLIKHTGCGMLTFQNGDAHALVDKNLGADAAKEVENLDFLPFSDLEAEVKKDVAFLKGSSTVAKDTVVTGWIYEVESGKARQVV